MDELRTSERILGVVVLVASFAAVLGRHFHGGRECYSRQVLGQRAVGRTRLCGGSARERTLGLAFADEGRCLERSDALVSPTRQRGKLPQAIENCAAHPEVRVRTKRHAASRIKTPSSIEQSFAAGPDEIIELNRATDGARDLCGDDLDQRKLCV